jgi:hypothetical protein
MLIVMLLSYISYQGANMEKILLLTIFFIIMQCTSPNKLDENRVYFDPVYLNDLSLDKLPAFWNGDSLIDISNRFSPFYSYCDGHIDQRFYSSGSKKFGVVVFSNSAFASTAIEAYKNGGSAIFRRGDTTGGKTWWFTGWFYSNGSCELDIIYLKNNTVIEATQNAPSFELAQDSLWDAINEVEKRITYFSHSSPPVPKGKYFNTTYREDLDLSNIPIFWQDDTVRYDSRSGMYSDTGLLRHIGYTSGLETGGTQGVHKGITLNVFKSAEFAVQALHASKARSQAITYYGEPKSPIKGLWWSVGDSINPSYTYICFQKLNTVLEVTYIPNNNEIVINTILEIARRIDELST